MTGEPGAVDQNIQHSTVEHSEKHTDKGEGATYICPMHPQIMQHEPGGSCPICGMDLVAKENTAPSGATAVVDKPQVFLDAVVIQNMGVRTAKVDRKILEKTIHTQGLVTADDDRLLQIHSRTGGWIEKLYLLTEGDRVDRKEVLVDFYSPWINQAQLKYIEALEEYDMTSFDPSKKTEVGAKVDSMRNSLRLLKVMDMDIMRIKNSRKVQNTIQLLAPQGGVIIELNVSEGTYVEPYQSMFTIVDLSRVWVMVDIYEHQASWVRKGNIVEIAAPAISARNWQGVVDFIYPEVDPKTRTLRARITVDNPDEALLLNMFVKVDITANSTQQAVLTVPREAVILTGERETVIKSLGSGHFQPVDVKTGRRGGGSVEVLSGLQQGEEIVVSGQFLIDSESSLQASFLRMSE
ncbi:MAG: efflux RND transporter periplasmic adaptor subunit [Proteobacteria bacterium]|nr:efflux RND transporter periplasmic adaptor subunit [Pseudomonadota bacterium]